MGGFRWVPSPINFWVVIRSAPSACSSPYKYASSSNGLFWNESLFLTPSNYISRIVMFADTLDTADQDSGGVVLFSNMVVLPFLLLVALLHL